MFIILLLCYHRTTNAAESFHRTYNGQFYYSYPPIYSVLTVLLETQSETDVKIYSIISNNEKKKMTLRETERIETIIRAYDKYKSCKSQDHLLYYLSLTGHTYQGKSL